MFSCKSKHDFGLSFSRYDFPQYGSRRRLISPMYDEYGEVIMEDDGYYYEVLPFF